MKCQRQPRFLEGRPVQISNVLEVRLAPLHWNRIKICAWQRRRSYSTITRYCVMKLARKCALRWTVKMRAATRSVREGLNIAQDVHRHMVCLYGEDEKLIRLAAMDLGITMTAFVRLGIELYLPALAMEKRSYRNITDADLTWEGVRFIEKVQIFAVNGGPWPFARDLSCQRFDLDSYW